MQYQVFVQSHAEKKFIASVIGIPNSTVEGSTKEEAIALAKSILETQLANGELVTIEVGQKQLSERDATQTQPETDPWIKHMGIFADDPTFDDFLAQMTAYRQQVDVQEVSE